MIARIAFCCAAMMAATAVSAQQNVPDFVTLAFNVGVSSPVSVGQTAPATFSWSNAGSAGAFDYKVVFAGASVGSISNISGTPGTTCSAVPGENSVRMQASLPTPTASGSCTFDINFVQQGTVFPSIVTTGTGCTANFGGIPNSCAVIGPNSIQVIGDQTTTVPALNIWSLAFLSVLMGGIGVIAFGRRS